MPSTVRNALEVWQAYGVPPEKSVSPGALLLWQLLICGILGGLGTPLGRQHGEVERSLVQAGPTGLMTGQNGGKALMCSETRVEFSAL